MDVIRILNESITVANQTNGFFDPTIGSLTIDVYRFGRDLPNALNQSDIEKAKKLINYKDLEILDSSVYLKKKGMKLDLGGLAKVMLLIDL